MIGGYGVIGGWVWVLLGEGRQIIGMGARDGFGV